MSGPKCTAWSVAENLRLQALARQAAWDAANRLEADVTATSQAYQATLARTETSISAKNVPIAQRPNSEAPTDAVERYVVQLRAKLAFLRGEMDQAETTAKLAEVLAGAIRSQREQALRQGEAERGTAQATLEQRAEDVRRIASRLPATATRAEREMVGEKAGAALAAPNAARAQSLEMDLRAAVQTARDSDRARTAAVARAETLLAELRGLAGDDVQRLAGRLEAAAMGVGRLDAGLEAEVVQVAAKARARADRDYAAEVLREEFEALGYDVGDDFQTAFAKGGSVSVKRPDRSPYSVLVSIDPHGGSVDTEVVRHGLSGASEIEAEREDLAAEEAWCDDFSAVLTEARRRKVIARVVRDTPPGTRRVAVIGDANQLNSSARARRPSARTL